jgi:hypothetical protein
MARKKRYSIYRYLFWVVSAGTSALLIQHFILYRLLMLPGLASLQSMPLYWWLCYLTPSVVVLLVAGVKSENFKGVVVASVLLALSANMVALYWAKSGEPGFARGYEIDQLGSFVKDYAFHFLIFLVVMSVGRVVLLLLDNSFGRVYRRFK